MTLLAPAATSHTAEQLEFFEARVDALREQGVVIYGRTAPNQVSADVPIEAVAVDANPEPISGNRVENIRKLILKAIAKGGRGQQSPATAFDVFAEDEIQIGDGLHRVRAIEILGLPNLLAEINLASTRTDVLRHRICATKEHVLLQQARMHWVKELWSLSPIGQSGLLTLKQALALCGPNKAATRKKLTDLDREEVQKWVGEVVNDWGTDATTMYNYYIQNEEYPLELVAMVRNGTRKTSELFNGSHMLALVDSAFEGDIEWQLELARIITREAIPAKNVRALCDDLEGVGLLADATDLLANMDFSKYKVPASKNGSNGAVAQAKPAAYKPAPPKTSADALKKVRSGDLGAIDAVNAVLAVNNPLVALSVGFSEGSLSRNAEAVIAANSQKLMEMAAALTVLALARESTERDEIATEPVVEAAVEKESTDPDSAAEAVVVGSGQRTGQNVHLPTRATEPNPALQQIVAATTKFILNRSSDLPKISSAAEFVEISDILRKCRNDGIGNRTQLRLLEEHLGRNRHLFVGRKG